MSGWGDAFYIYHACSDKGGGEGCETPAPEPAELAKVR